MGLIFGIVKNIANDGKHLDEEIIFLSPKKSEWLETSQRHFTVRYLMKEVF